MTWSPTLTFMRMLAGAEAAGTLKCGLSAAVANAAACSTVDAKSHPNAARIGRPTPPPASIELEPSSLDTVATLQYFTSHRALSIPGREHMSAR